MGIICDYITIFFTVYVIIRLLPTIKLSSKLVYLTMLAVFYVLPIFLDRFIAFPEYDYYAGFDETYNIPKFRIIYDIILCIIIYIIYKSNIKKTNHIIFASKNINISWYFLGMIIAPLITIFIMKNTMILFFLQWRELGLIFLENLPYYSLAEKFSYVGICCASLVLFQSKNSLQHPFLFRFLATLLLYINICIEGKRGAIFFAIVVIIIILVTKFLLTPIEKYNKITKVNIMNLAVLISISLFSVYIMLSITTAVQSDRGGNTSMYTKCRIDFLRDDRIKLVIADELSPSPVLEYPGKTIVDKWKYIVPLNLVLDKYHVNNDPLIYQHYFSSLVNKSKPSEDLCYMTVTIFAELISNFGIIIGSMLFAFLCICFYRITDKFPYPMNAFLLSSFVMLNMFDVSYGMPLFEICFIICFIYYNKQKKNQKCQNQ